MKSYIAIAVCLLSVLIEAFIGWRTHHLTYAQIEAVAFVWLMAGMWLNNQLGRVMNSSPSALYRELRTTPIGGVARTLINGGIILGLASIGMLCL